MINRLAMFGAVAVMGMAGLANAATITYDAPFSIVPVNGVDTAYLPYFNLPGTLTSVSIWFDGGLTGTFTFTSGAAPGDTATATLSTVVFAAYTPTGTNLFDNSITTGAQGPLSAGQSVHVGPPATGTINIPAVAFGDGPADDTDIAYYGIGNFPVNLSSIGNWGFTVSGSGDVGSATVGFSSAVSGEVHVQYTYDAIPEPASLGLLSLGGLALIRRRRDR